MIFWSQLAEPQLQWWQFIPFLLLASCLVGWAVLIQRSRQQQHPLRDELGLAEIVHPWGAILVAAFVAMVCLPTLMQSGPRIDELPQLPAAEQFSAIQQAMLQGNLVGTNLVCVLLILALIQKQLSQGTEVAWLSFLPSKRDWYIALGAWLLCAPLLFMIQGILQYLVEHVLKQQPQVHPLIEVLMTLKTDQTSQIWTLLGLVAFSVAINAPLLEELFFRGLLQTWLRRTFPQLSPWVPITITALIFAGLHANQGPAPIPLFGFALVLGYLYERTGRLAPSILTHALFNFSTTIMLAGQLYLKAAE